MKRLALVGSVLLGFVAPAFGAIVESEGDIDLYTDADVFIDVHTPALAVNTNDDHVIYTWTLDDGTGRYDVIFAVVTFAAPLQVVAFPVPVDETDGTVRNVEVAWNATAEAALVVWEQDTAAAPGCFEIWGRAIDRSYAFVGPAFRISTMGASDTDPAFDAGMPDVAANAIDGDFVVVWHGDDDASGLANGRFEIFGRRVRADGTLSGSGRDAVSEIGDGLSSLDPAIGYDDFHGEYLVVHSRDLGASDFRPQVTMTRVGADGLRLGGIADAAIGRRGVVGPLGPQRNVDLAFDARRKKFLVVWDETQTLSSNEAYVMSRVVDLALSAQTSFIAPVSKTPNGGGQIDLARDPAVVYSLPAGHWVVSWSGQPDVGGPHEKEIIAREVDSFGDPFGSHVALSTTGTPGAIDVEAVTPSLIASEQSARLHCAWAGTVNGPGNFGLAGQFFTVDAVTSTPDAGRPDRLALHAAPNPFNPATTISFDLPRPGRARVTIHDVRGARVRVLVDEVLEAGVHQQPWNGRDARGRPVASGVYFARIEHEGQDVRRKITLVK